MVKGLRSCIASMSINGVDVVAIVEISEVPRKRDVIAQIIRRIYISIEAQSRLYLALQHNAPSDWILEGQDIIQSSNFPYLCSRDKGVIDQQWQTDLILWLRYSAFVAS